MGDRPAELDRASASVVAQQGDPAEILVVGNGIGGIEGTGEPVLGPLPAPARFLALADNVGIPAGRNAGVAATSGDLVLFLDDDGWLPATDALDRVRAAF